MSNTSIAEACRARRVHALMAFDSLNWLIDRAVVGSPDQPQRPSRYTPQQSPPPGAARQHIRRHIGSLDLHGAGARRPKRQVAHLEVAAAVVHRNEPSLPSDSLDAPDDMGSNPSIWRGKDRDGKAQGDLNCSRRRGWRDLVDEDAIGRFLLQR